MPTAALYHGTQATAHASHPFSLHANAVDLIDITSKRGFGFPIESLTISEVGANGASSMSFLYQDAKRVLALPANARIQLNDHVANETLFAGFIMGRRASKFAGQGYQVDVTATDYSYLLDTTYLPAAKWRAGHTDKALIEGVLHQAIRNPHIYAHTSLVTSTNSNMPALDFSHLSLRAAIEAIQAAAGENRHYYVDFLGRLHYYLGPTEAGMGAAPYVISDAPSGAQRAAEGLVLEYDDSQIVNNVYIFGGTPAGSGWEKDEVSIKAYGLRQGTFNAPHSRTSAHRVSAGRHFLVLHKDPIVRGSFVTTGSDTGWRVGQTLTLTNVAEGLSSATYPVVQIDTTFLSGTGIRSRVISFGDLPASGRRSPRPAGRGGTAATQGPPAMAMPQPSSRLIGYMSPASDRTIN